MIQAATTGAPYPFVVVRAVTRLQRNIRREQQVMRNCATNLVNVVRTRNARLMLQKFRKRATCARTRWAALKEHLRFLADANRRRTLRPNSTVRVADTNDTCVGDRSLVDSSGEHHAAVMVSLAPTERSGWRPSPPRSSPAPDVAMETSAASEYTGASWRRPLFSGDYRFCGQLVRFHLEVQAPTAPAAPDASSTSRKRACSPYAQRSPQMMKIRPYSPPSERRRK